MGNPVHNGDREVIEMPCILKMIVVSDDAGVESIIKMLTHKKIFYVCNLSIFHIYLYIFIQTDHATILLRI